MHTASILVSPEYRAPPLAGRSKVRVASNQKSHQTHASQTKKTERSKTFSHGVFAWSNKHRNAGYTYSPLLQKESPLRARREMAGTAAKRSQPSMDQTSSLIPRPRLDSFHRNSSLRTIVAACVCSLLLPRVQSLSQTSEQPTGSDTSSSTTCCA